MKRASLCAIALTFLFACAPSEIARTFEPAGSQRSRWQVPFDGSDSTPVIAGSVLYVGSRDGAVYAIDLNSGQMKWRFQTGEGLVSGPEIITVPRGTGLAEMMGTALSRPKQGKKEVDATPVVEDGSVYVGSRDHSLYAIDAATGNKKWSYQTGGEIRYGAMVKTRVVYFVSADSFLYAIDALTGQKKWAFETLPGLVKTAKRSPNEPIMDGETIYLTNWPLLHSGIPEKSYLYAIDTESGREKWVFEVNGKGATMPSTGGGLVLFSTYPSGPRVADLFAVEASSGKLKWQFQAEQDYSLHRPVIVSGNAVNFATDKGLFALDINTGNKRWNFSGQISGGQTTVVNFRADERHVYVVTEKGSIMRPDDTLHALDPSTGQEKWSYAPGGIFGGGGIRMKAIHEGLIYSGAGPHLDAIDAMTGKKLWSFKTGTRVESEPLIVGKMIFMTSATQTYVGKPSEQGYLYAIDRK